jgi:hypothetical protein
VAGPLPDRPDRRSPARPGRGASAGGGSGGARRGRGFGAGTGRQGRSPSGRPDGAGSDGLHRRGRAGTVPLPLSRRQRRGLPPERALSGDRVLLHAGAPGRPARHRHPAGGLRHLGRHPDHPRRPTPGRAPTGRDGHPRDPRPRHPAEPRPPHPGRAGLARDHLGRHAAARERRFGGGRERRVAGRGRPPGRLAPRERADRPRREAARAPVPHARRFAGAAAADPTRGENKRAGRGGRHPGDGSPRRGGQPADPGSLVPALERRAIRGRDHHHHTAPGSGRGAALARAAGGSPGTGSGRGHLVGAAAAILETLAELDARYAGRDADTPPDEWSAYQERRARLKAELAAALAAR